MKEITPEIREAIELAANKLGSRAELERRSGVSQVYLSRYISGQTHHIKNDIWNKLAVFIQPHFQTKSITAQLKEQAERGKIEDVVNELTKLGISPDTPAINIVVIKRVAKLTEDQCWKLCGVIAKLEEEASKEQTKTVHEEGERYENGNHSVSNSSGNANSNVTGNTTTSTN